MHEKTSSLLHDCMTGRPAVLRNSFRLACKYRKVPAECFEHLHLVSFPYEHPLQAHLPSLTTDHSSRKLWRLTCLNNLYPRFPSRIILPIIFIFWRSCNHSMKITIPFFQKSAAKACQQQDPTSFRHHFRIINLVHF